MHTVRDWGGKKEGCMERDRTTEVGDTARIGR